MADKTTAAPQRCSGRVAAVTMMAGPPKALFMFECLRKATDAGRKFASF